MNRGLSYILSNKITLIAHIYIYIYIYPAGQAILDIAIEKLIIKLNALQDTFETKGLSSNVKKNVFGSGPVEVSNKKRG